ncbi:MAG: recombination protein RecR [Patescibacteria group bacterium]
MLLTPLFKKIINFFNRFNELGPRQSIRFLFWLLKQNDDVKKTFLNDLINLLETTKFCSSCFFPYPSQLCPICSDKKRLDEIIMVVARETDVLSLETAKVFKGKYFILGGLILPFENNELIKERIKIFEERLKNKKIKEVIIGLPYTKEALPTLKIIESLSKKYPKIKFTKLARGIPTGGEIEFIDPETLKEALEKRD